MNQYSFPLLDEPDLIAFLDDIGFPFQPQWKKPTSAIATDIYINLVDIVIGVEKERLSRPELAIMGKHSMHQDVYTRGLPELGMLMMIFQCMEACCVHNFSLKDITNPTWPRIRTIISGLINFVRFQHEFFTVFEDTVEKTQQMELQHQQLISTVDKLTQQYNKYIGSPEVQLLKQLQQQQKILEDELIQKREQRKLLEEEHHKDSSKVTQLQKKVLTLDETIKGLRYELDLLKAKDVTGLYRDVESLRAKVEVQQNTIDIQQQDLIILRSKQDYTDKFIRCLTSLITELEDYQRTMSISQDGISRLQILQTQLQTSQAQSTQQHNRKDELNQQLNILKDELSNLSTQHDSLIKTKQQAIHDLLVQKSELEIKDRENIAQIGQLELNMVEIKNEMVTMSKKHQLLLDDAIKRIILLSDAIDSFHQRIHKSIEHAQNLGNNTNNTTNNDVTTTITTNIQQQSSNDNDSYYHNDEHNNDTNQYDNFQQPLPYNIHHQQQEMYIHEYSDDEQYEQ